MEIKVKRIARKDAYTIGKMYVNGEYVCDTLEDKDRGLTSNMSVAQICGVKVHGETAKAVQYAWLSGRADTHRQHGEGHGGLHPRRR